MRDFPRDFLFNVLRHLRRSDQPGPKIEIKTGKARIRNRGKVRQYRRAGSRGDSQSGDFATFDERHCGGNRRKEILDAAADRVGLRLRRAFERQITTLIFAASLNCSPFMCVPLPTPAEP